MHLEVIPQLQKMSLISHLKGIIFTERVLKWRNIEIICLLLSWSAKHFLLSFLSSLKILYIPAQEIFSNLKARRHNKSGEGFQISERHNPKAVSDFRKDLSDIKICRAICLYVRNTKCFGFRISHFLYRFGYPKRFSDLLWRFAYINAA